MASTLRSNFNNSYHTQANRLTNRLNRVKVLVEDGMDVPFWYDVLTNCDDGTHTFDITPFCYSIHTTSALTRGKSNVLKELGSFGAAYIGCVDSDFDYLLPFSSPLSSYAEEMNQNRYVLHTYTYAIENHFCHPKTLKQLCVTITKDTDVSFDFEAYMLEFSEIVYPLLIWILYLENINRKIEYASFVRVDFDEVIPCDKNVCQVSKQDILNKLKKNVNRKVAHYETLFQFDALYKVSAFAKDLEVKGVFPENAYQYIKGHDLYKFLMATALKPVCGEVIKQHRKAIANSGATQEEINNRMNQYNKQVGAPDLEKKLNENYEYKRYCAFYQRMRTDVQQIWQP